MYCTGYGSANERSITLAREGKVLKYLARVAISCAHNNDRDLVIPNQGYTVC